MGRNEDLGWAGTTRDSSSGMDNEKTDQDFGGSVERGSSSNDIEKASFTGSGCEGYLGSFIVYMCHHPYLHMLILLCSVGMTIRRNTGIYQTWGLASSGTVWTPCPGPSSKTPKQTSLYTT